jgi:hypothetical protein
MSYISFNHLAFDCGTSASSVGLYINGTSILTEVSKFDDVNIQGCGIGAEILGSGGLLYFNKLDINASKNDGIYIAGNNMFDIFVDNSNITTSRTNNLELSAVNGYMTRLYFHNTTINLSGNSVAETAVYAHGSGHTLTADFTNLSVANLGGTSPTNQISSDSGASISLQNPNLLSGIPVSIANPANVLDYSGLTVGSGTSPLTTPFGILNGFNGLSADQGSIGFNRDVANGHIFNSGSYAYQLTNHTSWFGMDVYNGVGSSITPNAFAVVGATGDFLVGTSTDCGQAFCLNGSMANDNGILLPSALTGYHGTSGTKVQLSDGTGTSTHPAIYASDGSLTDGPDGYTGSCASTTTLTVVKGIITGCS